MIHTVTQSEVEMCHVERSRSVKILLVDNLNITNYSNRLDLINETAQQIIKDFGESGKEIVFSGNPETAYTELFNQISPHIRNLFETRYSYLLTILYRIDIPENIYYPLMQGDSKNKIEELTDIIIKREFQKIVIRNHYKNNPEK